ncbi:hypothetical protein MKX03_029889, partial [Papaver bracteatum]
MYYPSADALNEAAKVYIKLAGYHFKLGKKHEAALAYVDAAKTYEWIYDIRMRPYQAVEQFKEIGSLNMV